MIEYHVHCLCVNYVFCLRISSGWGLLVRLKLLDALGERMDHILCTYSWIIDKLVESFWVEFG